MSRAISEVETVLREMIVEHRKLLGHVQNQYAAMRAMDVPAMVKATHLQEASRARINNLEVRRVAVVKQIGSAARLPEPVNISALATQFPREGPMLLKLRDELKGLITETRQTTQLAMRVSGAVLGHLNTAMRILAGAVERAGVYTRSGNPRLGRRIGVMDAVA